MRPAVSDRGQATVEFALLLPFFALLVACVLGVTAVCLDILHLQDTARTVARLAAVSADPPATAREHAASLIPGTQVTVRTDQGTVTVALSRRIGARVPLLRSLRFGIPWSASCVMALEPPWGSVTADPGTIVPP